LASIAGSAIEGSMVEVVLAKPVDKNDTLRMAKARGFQVLHISACFLHFIFTFVVKQYHLSCIIMYK
jgi:hypothetical protein